MIYQLILFISGIYGGSAIDARIYKQPERVECRPYPKWLESDWVYLVFPCVLLLAMVFALHFSYFTTKEFICYTLSGLILASLSWDISFGIVKYYEPFRPFRKWVFNMGFGGYQYQRILADVLRVIFAVAMNLI